MAIKLNQSAFSLVELSLVLVILGLLVGGVLSGRALIRAAELRSITIEQQQYESALYAFREKYMALPGDFALATRFWGAQAGDCLKEPSPDGKLTCNGNGDGKINYLLRPQDSHEGFRVWQHLANAGLVAGSYSGIGYGTARNLYKAGATAPASKYPNGVWSLWHTVTSEIWAVQGDRLYLTLGAAYPTQWHMPLLSAPEAWQIDEKMDDGKPYTGRITDVARSYTPNCTTSEDHETAEYRLDVDTPACVLMYGLH